MSADVHLARTDNGAARGQVLAALPELEQLAKKAADDCDMPGMSIVVIYRDEAVYLKGFGVREAGKSELVDGDTVLQLASCSKPMASTIPKFRASFFVPPSSSFRAGYSNSNSGLTEGAVAAARAATTTTKMQVRSD